MHFHLGFEALTGGPGLGIFPLAGRAARDRTKLGRERNWKTRLPIGKKGAWKSWEEVDGVVMVWCWLCDRLGLLGLPFVSNLNFYDA